MKCWGKQDAEWVQTPATNGSGGIIITWHKDSFSAINSFIGQR